MQEPEIYGRLTVLSKDGDFWVCRCSCGREVKVRWRAVKYGATKSCGCLRAELLKARTVKLIEVGSKFERLTVVAYSGKRCECLCDCGATVFVSSTHLRTGHTQSCGCLQKERAHDAALHPVEKGAKFGKLTVMEQIRDKCLCRCECGKSTTVETKKLRFGHVKSCGCRRLELCQAMTLMKILPAGETALHMLYAQYRCQAGYRRLEFKVSVDEFQALTKQNCYYCGAEPAQIKRSPGAVGAYVYNGVDRVDNSKGYIISNLKPCCGCCNMAKKNSTERDFLDWVQALSDFVPKQEAIWEGTVLDVPAYRIVYRRYQNFACFKKLGFELTFEDFFKLTQSHCHYCGRAPHRKTGQHSEFLYTGIDRVNSELGYTLDNVVPSCWDCNNAKLTGNAADLKSWADRVVRCRGLCQRRTLVSQ